MRVRYAVEAFKLYKPKTVLEILNNCRVPLQYVSSGAFRDSYRVGDLPLIVKTPIEDSHAKVRTENIEHSRREMRVLKRILRCKKYRSLRQYMPKVYYYNQRTGIIAMHEYQKKRLSYKVRLRIAEEFRVALQIKSWDWHIENFGIDTNGRFVLLDLGCLEKDSCANATS